MHSCSSPRRITRASGQHWLTVFAFNRRSADGGGSSHSMGKTVVLPLSRGMRKSFKRYLKRSHGASTPGAKAQLQLVLQVLGSVMAEARGDPFKPMDLG